MSFRFRPALTILEARENPSVPGIDPIGGSAPPPSDPPPAEPTPVEIAIAAAVAGAGGGSTAPTNDPLLQTNPLFGVPVVQP